MEGGKANRYAALQGGRRRGRGVKILSKSALRLNVPKASEHYMNKGKVANAWKRVDEQLGVEKGNTSFNE